MCKISIIMPVYNKEKYIKKAIESILNQTFKDWEMLIIDDGSTDDSLAVCRIFEDPRIHVISTENGGVSHARNIGVDKAQGEYLTFVDGDDYLAADYLENLYIEPYDMIIGGLTKVDKAGKVLASVVPELEKEQRMEKIAPFFYKEQLATGIYGFVAGKMVKRSIVTQYQIRFNENIRLAEDYDFFLKIYAKIESIYFTKATGYYYIQETENSAIVLDDSKIDFFSQIEIQRKTRQFLEDKKCFHKENEAMYLERMTGYVYTIFLNQKQVRYREIRTTAKRLKQLVPVVSPKCSGLQKIFMGLYKRNCYMLMYLYLKMKKAMSRHGG